MLIPPVSEKDHIDGTEEARLTLVEYGDFECPHSGRAYVYLKEIRQELGEQLRFVFRHFPIIDSHPHAETAAEAAECAAEQGNFWQMHDKLFEHQNALEEEYLIKYAKDLNLDVPKFRENLRGHTFKRKVDDDAISGEENGVEATPTFFINGEIYEGPNSKEILMNTISQAVLR